MDLAIEDANMLIDAAIMNEKDPAVRKEGWIMLFDHAIDFLEAALE